LNTPDYFSKDFNNEAQPIAWITGHKVSLSTAGLKFGVPKAFDLSAKRDEFINYANAHPDKFWVKKNNEHRGIKIRNIKELDLSDNNSFIQEYISQPLLIDNRKFDIGIYTVITSVFPLRVYIYGGDALLRFCSKDYEPFDANDIDKYVVADNYTPLWEMPSLKKYYVEQQMTFQHAFNAYISELGKDPDIIWDRIKEIIAAVFESQQNKMIAAGANFVDKRPFFELSRFDFVLDKDLNVYLMEANLSPNLSSGHFLPNKLLYKQVIINVLSLVGIASHLHGISPKDRLKIYKNKPYFSEDGDNQEMLVSDRDIQVFNNDCFSNSSKCSGKDGCKKELKCQLCRHCMNYQLRDILRSAYEEHMSRRIMRRILPRTVHKTRRFDILRSELDRLLTLWFDDKCKDDKTWCF
uniref:Tubulin polyglutamylase TTLL6 n=1 Tax=Elaeophora elaphi TaxID=1147741 RepID=A0A158Q783_9BILA